MSRGAAWTNAAPAAGHLIRGGGGTDPLGLWVDRVRAWASPGEAGGGLGEGWEKAPGEGPGRGTETGRWGAPCEARGASGAGISRGAPGASPGVGTEYTSSPLSREPTPGSRAG